MASAHPSPPAAEKVLSTLLSCLETYRWRSASAGWCPESSLGAPGLVQTLAWASAQLTQEHPTDPSCPGLALPSLPSYWVLGTLPFRPSSTGTSSKKPAWAVQAQGQLTEGLLQLFAAPNIHHEASLEGTHRGVELWLCMEGSVFQARGPRRSPTRARLALLRP